LRQQQQNQQPSSTPKKQGTKRKPDVSPEPLPVAAPTSSFFMTSPSSFLKMGGKRQRMVR
jgi:hypothetical protein